MSVDCVSVQCPAKTNLTLHVGPRHEEWGGRHELDTIYCALGVYDCVRVTRNDTHAGFSLDLDGQYLGDLASSQCDIRHNHAIRALLAMANASGCAPDVHVYIEKNIPVAAGLGGGSADAAATMLALNELWDLHWPMERLRPIAAELGADMPFCLTGGYAHGTGFGEVIEPLAANDAIIRDLRERGYCGDVIVGAFQAELSTPEVYAAFDEIGNPLQADNDLQYAAINLHPRSGTAIDIALHHGASQAFVSGSGPSVIAFAADTSAIAHAWEQSGCVDRIIVTSAPALPRVSLICC